MSRIGRKPIQVPSGVDVKIDGHHITVKGPKGTLEQRYSQGYDGIPGKRRDYRSPVPAMTRRTARCTD